MADEPQAEKPVASAASSDAAPKSEPDIEQQPVTAPPAAAAGSEIPDGGAQAYLTLLGGWLTLFTTVGYANAFGVYQDYFTRTGLSSPSNISWIGSVQLFLLLVLGLPSGKLLDKGYFRPMMITGSIIYVFSFFMMSLTHPDKYYQVFLSQGVGVGLGSGLIYVPAAAIQGHHWKKHRALVMGVAFSGGSVGGIVYPIMLNQLIFGRVGFAWGVRAAAFLTMGFLLIANLTMSTRLPPKRTMPKGSSRKFLLDPAFLFAVTGLFLIAWGIFFPYFYLQLFSVEHRINETFAFYTIAILNGASVIGRTVPNFYADRTGPFNMLIPSCFFSGALIWAMFGLRESIAATTIFTLLYGFFSGSYFSLLGPALVSLVKEPSEIGMAIGAGFSVASFACLTGTPIDGAFLPDNTFPWHKPIIFSAATVLGGTVSLIVSRQILVRRKKTWKT